ncbi:class B sortase [Candidatus Saccharibacteria bacterium]|nr:class B sortase [Candidatus Saccharibacteria bacterium]MBQ3318804.1 class B sortase [Candidatus Saccharibacteria bacterium]
MNRRWIFGVVLLFLGSVLAGYAGINFVVWKVDSERTNEAITELKKIAITEENGDQSAFSVSEKMTVNFSELLRQNNDTVAWVEFLSTEVSYPVVQTSDNEFYLRHSFDKRGNSAGWVFMDYRNRADFSDFNTIFYAHGRLDNTMFGSLNEAYKNKKFSRGQKIQVYTARENFEYEIISVYLTAPTDDYIKTNFSDEKEKKTFINMILGRDELGLTSSATEEDEILTLSTCYDSSRRLVVHAKKVI